MSEGAWRNHNPIGDVQLQLGSLLPGHRHEGTIGGGWSGKGNARRWRDTSECRRNASPGCLWTTAGGNEEARGLRNPAPDNGEGSDSPIPPVADSSTYIGIAVRCRHPWAPK